MFNQNFKKRKIKKIFQWREYLNWKQLSPIQKINFKRAILFPFLAYIVYFFLAKYSISILIIIGIYFLFRYKNTMKLKK